MTTLTCACGRSLDVRGMPPGKEGRCPACGASVRVPDDAPAGEDEWDWDGVYDVAEPPPPPVDAPAPTPPVSGEEKKKPKPPPDPGAWFPPPLLFPARSLEGLVVVVAIGFTLWVLATLVPEYCVALMSDSDGLGARPMGHLVGIVTSMPFAFVAPLAAAYWLQYLGRVLVNAAGGEKDPPRPPDRDFEGLLGGFLS